MSQIRKFQDGGISPEVPVVPQVVPEQKNKKITVEGLGEFDPEELRTKFAKSSDSYFESTGANPKYRQDIFNRISEILDLSGSHGLKLSTSGEFTFTNPDGIHDKFKSTGKFSRKGILGLGGTKMDDNAINNFAYYTIERLIRGNNQPSTGGQYSSTSGQYNNNDRYTADMSEVDATLRDMETRAQTEAATGNRGKTRINSINWQNFVNQGLYSGNTPNINSFRERYADNTSRYNVFADRLDDEIKALENAEWDTKHTWSGKGTKEDYIASIKGLRDSIRNSGGVYTEDIRNRLYDLGTNSSLRAFLDDTHTPETQSEEASGTVVPYDYSKSYDFKEGYDARTIYQAFREKYGSTAPVMYDPVRKELVFGITDAHVDFNPYLSPYNSVYSGGIWYKDANGGYYYYNNESAPEMTDEEKRKYNQRGVDVFHGDLIPQQFRFNKDTGEGVEYQYDASSDSIEELEDLNLPEDFMGSIIDMSDLFTGNKTVFRYYDAKKAEAGETQNTYGLYINNEYKYGTVVNNPTKGVVFVENGTNKEFDLGTINRQGKAKPFTIESDSKIYNPHFEGDLGNIEDVKKYVNQVLSFGNIDYIKKLKTDKLIDDYPRGDKVISNYFTREDIFGQITINLRGQYVKKLRYKLNKEPIKNKNGEILVRDGNSNYYWYNEKTTDTNLVLTKIVKPKEKKTQSQQKIQQATPFQQFEPKFDYFSPTLKQGGILKAQRGTLYDRDQLKVARERAAKQRSVEEQRRQVLPGETQGQEYIFTSDYNPNEDRASSSTITYGDVFDSDLELSAADKVELAALAADFSSVVLGFVPGANVAGAIAGATGSFGQFGTDVAREGWGVGNSIGLIGNLFMDAASLIPVLGSSAKIALKLPKSIVRLTKHLPKLSKIAMAGGAVAATSTLSKINDIRNDPNRSYSELTTQDFRNLFNLLRGVSTYQKSKAVRQAKPGTAGTKTETSVKVTTREGYAKDMKLTDAELKQLNNQSTKSEKESFLNKVISDRRAAYQKASVEGTLTPEQIELGDLVEAVPQVYKMDWSKPHQWAPFKGRVRTSTKTGPDDGTSAALEQLTYRHNGWYKRRLRETPDWFGPKGTGSSGAKATGKSTTSETPKASTEAPKASTEAPKATSEAPKASTNTKNDGVLSDRKVRAKNNNSSPDKAESLNETKVKSESSSKPKAESSTKVTETPIQDNTEVSNLRTKIENLNSRKTSLNQQLEENTDYLKNLEARPKTEQSYKQISKEKNNIVSLNNELSRIEKQLSKTEASLISARTNTIINSAAKSTESHVKNVENSRFRKNSPNTKYFARRQELEQMQKELRKLENKPESKSSQKQITKLKEDIKKLNDELTQLLKNRTTNITKKLKGGLIPKFQNPAGRVATYAKNPMGVFSLQPKYNLIEHPTQHLAPGSSLYNQAVVDSEAERAQFISRNHPWQQGFVVDGKIIGDYDTTLKYQQGFNKYNTATRDLFLHNKWADEKELNEYHDSQGFVEPTGNTAAGAEGLAGAFTTSRGAYRRQVVTPDQKRWLNNNNMITARQVLGNESAKKYLGDDLYNNIIKDLDRFEDADWTIDETLRVPDINPLIVPKDILKGTNPNDTKTVPTDKGIGAIRRPKPEEPKEKGSWDPIPMMRAAEAIIGIRGNNKLKAPQETPRDPLDLYTYVTGDLQQRSMYQNEAAKVRSKSSRPFTSDASLHAARELEGESVASGLTAKGWNADANAIKETGYRAVERQHENARNRNQIANENKAIFDRNEYGRTMLKNQVNLANHKILQNVVKDQKDEMIQNREAYRNARVAQLNEKSALDRDRDYGKLYRDYARREDENERSRTAIAGHEADIKKWNEDPVANKDNIDEANKKIKNAQDIIDKNDKENNTFHDRYYQSALNAINNRLKNYGSIAQDNTWARRYYTPSITPFKKGGQLSYTERSFLQSQKDANLASRELSRNIERKSRSERQEEQKWIREMAKLFEGVLQKRHKTARLK